jgi:hypothetical protein
MPLLLFSLLSLLFLTVLFPDEMFRCATDTDCKDEAQE